MPPFLLTPMALSNAASLLQALQSYHQLNETAVLEARNDFAGELKTLSAHINSVRAGRGKDLGMVSALYRGAKTAKDIAAYRGLAEDFLKGLEKSLFQGLRKIAGFGDGAADAAENAVASGQALVQAPRQEPARLQIKIDGKALEPAVEGDCLYPLVPPGTGRKPVTLRAETVATARLNLENGIERDANGFLQKHPAALKAHFEALLSGEIGAPLDVRTEAVEFLAKGLGHAIGYADIVAVDAQQLRLQTPWPYIPLIDIVEPRALPVEEKTELKLRSHHSSGTAYEMYWKLQELIRAPENKKIWEQLAAEAPDTYGVKAMNELQSAVAVLQGMEGMSDSKERVAYLSACAYDGSIPQTYLRYPEDRKLVTVPKTTPAAEPKMALPSGDVPTTPSENYPIAEKLDALAERLRVTAGPNVNEALAHVRQHLAAGNHDKARESYLRVLLYLAMQRWKKLAQEGVTAWENLEETVLKTIKDRRFDAAEDVLEFASHGMKKPEILVRRLRDLEVDLILHGEWKARGELRDHGNALLGANGFASLENLLNQVQSQVRSQLDGARTAYERHAGTFTRNVNAAVWLVLEAFRAIAVHHDAGTRNLLAAKLPTVRILLQKGPETGESNEAFYRSFHLPLPGDLGVPALPLSDAKQLLPQGTPKNT